VERELETEAEMKLYQEKRSSRKRETNEREREDKSYKHVNVLLGANIPLSCKAHTQCACVSARQCHARSWYDSRGSHLEHEDMPCEN
jgi:hypothetical protein